MLQSYDSCLVGVKEEMGVGGDVFSLSVNHIFSNIVHPYTTKQISFICNVQVFF